MIKFKALNVDGDEIQYKYENAEALVKEWRSDRIDIFVPANDDPVYDVMIDGVQDNEITAFDKFEDLLIYLGAQ